jgi:predicted dehydrogenase
MQNLQWGIIGPGNIAEEFAKDLVLVNNNSHQILSVLTNDVSAATSFAEAHGVANVYDDIDAFLSSAINAVYIATPHILHFEQSLACLKKRIAVLCEKPITINLNQLQALVATAREHHTFLMEGMWIRFLPSIRKVLSLIQSNIIGEVISVKASISYKAPYDTDNRYFNPKLGGGSLLDLGIYPVFLATLILGKPVAVKAVAAVSKEGIDEACSILLDYPNKQMASLESSLITKSELVAEIAGEKGRIKILSPWNEKPEGILVEIYDEHTINYPCKWEGRGFQFEVEEMVAAMQNNAIESSLMPHKLSIDVMEIMDEVRKQIKVSYPSFE